MTLTAATSASRLPPAERVRARVDHLLGGDVARRLPSGYQRLGSVLILRLPSELRPSFETIGGAWREELGVRTVLARTGPVSGEYRIPSLERIAGDGTDTELVEDGIRYRLDALRILFSEGNRTERRRVGNLVRPGEVVVDLFAGVGYFTLPALIHGGAQRVFAVEKNPASYQYLVENLERNAVSSRATTFLGDNRDALIPEGVADRAVLGYLPTSLPWVARAIHLLKPAGGTIHAHLAVGTRDGIRGAEAQVRAAVARTGRRVDSLRGREVKAYGPGRVHAVVDVRVGPKDST